MPVKKKKPRKINFIKRLQARPKIKAIRKKIAKNESDRKRLSKEYRRLLKSEAKILKKKR